MAFSRFDEIGISGIASAVPTATIELNSLEGLQTPNLVDQFRNKFGIEAVHRSNELQTSSDLGYVALKNILEKKNINTDEIGVLLFCSTTPDYRSPATACVLHSRIKATKDCLAFDVNVGGAGFVYGLQLGCSLLKSTSKKYAVVVLGDTTSKQVDGNDLFSFMYSDAASAVLLEKDKAADPIFLKTKATGEFYDSVSLKSGGFRSKSEGDYLSTDHKLISKFVISNIPKIIGEFLVSRHTNINDYDLLAIQQLGKENLKRISENLGLSFTGLPMNFEKFGDSRGSSIPLLMPDYINANKNSSRKTHILACGFGEGFALGVADFFISSDTIFPIIYTDEYFEEGVVSHDF
jgi:3-oxoacyl-[acyl-carrier-protein] synthase-3